MPMTIASFLRPCRLCISLLLTALFAFDVSAAEVASGTLTGRVFDASRGEFVRNAEVRIVGNDGLQAVSEDGGYFRIPEIPAGPATVVVTFTGYPAVRESVNVVAGQVTTKEFRLAVNTTGEKSDVIQLAAFTVNSEREGNAKAIMSQRNSMNITSAVASDTFGENAEGNVGEFVKNLPGVELELAAGVARNFRLRGLGSEYAGVTMDGITLSSADANQGNTDNARSFSFEQVSLSNLESIEISKTISADVDANAPAGTVNFRTRRAFDRDGRRIAWSLNFTGMGSRLEIDKTFGPDDVRRRKVLPGGTFEYSDIFLNKKLGIIFTLSESLLYSEENRIGTVYDRTPNNADRRPIVVTAVGVNHNPRINERFTTSLTADLRVTPRLSVGMGLIYNYSDLLFVQHSTRINTGARAGTGAGPDPLLNLNTSISSAGSVQLSHAYIAKLGRTITATPRFEYKHENVTLEGKFGISLSRSAYDPFGKYGAVRNVSVGNLTGISVAATRTRLDRNDWSIRQTGGPDWADGVNYRNASLTYNEGRFSTADTFSGDLTATTQTRALFPVTWKAGIKRRLEHRKFENTTSSMNYLYNGPGGGTTGSWGAFPTSYRRDLSPVDVSVASTSGRDIFGPNLNAIGELFRAEPSLFTPSLTAANYYDAFIANKKNYEETIDAAFLMGTTRVGRAQFRAGIRWEDTKTDALEFDPRPAREVTAAGFPVIASTGRASTIPGLEYQYFTRPRVHRVGGYDNFFPSGSVKYNFTPNLQAHLGYSTTIRRPTFRDIAGVWAINDDTQIVSAPNPNLRPEESDNFSARLAYYFEPVGLLAVNLFENRIKGAALQSELSAQEFGYAGGPLDTYTFVTRISSPSEIVVRGMELEYSQSLSFLPSPFNGLNIYANYTRNYATQLYPLMIPHSVKTGFSYAFKRFNMNAGYTWNDAYIASTNGRTYRWPRAVVDLGAGFRLNGRVSLFATAQNLLNAPYLDGDRVPGEPDLVVNDSRYGTLWTLGIKGRF